MLAVEPIEKVCPMNRLAAVVLGIGVCVSAPVCAGSSATSPLLGRWAVDTSRLPMPPAARPKSVTIAFRQASAAKITMQVDIVGADGQRVHTVGTAPLDGSPIPIEHSPEADEAAMKQPQPNVLVVALDRDGVPASTRIYAVASDRQSMVETAVYFGRDGKPIMRTNYFRRVR